jgi:RNA polymerase sigma factor, sigma-70 family
VAIAGNWFLRSGTVKTCATTGTAFMSGMPYLAQNGIFDEIKPLFINRLKILKGWYVRCSPLVAIGGITTAYQEIDVEGKNIQRDGTVIGVIALDLGGLARTSEKKLRGFIGKRVFNQADVDDLMQMTYLEAWRNQHKFMGTSRPETWLFGIAANLVRNHFKTFYNQPQRMELTDTEMESFEHGHDPSMLSDQQRTLGRTLAAIEELSVDMRAVLDLVVDADVSYQDAARHLAVPIGTIRSRLARARGQLKSSVYSKEVH